MAKEIVNVTDITEYLYCPRKVYLKRVKKIKPIATKVMILGFLKHKVFDLLNKNESLIVSQITSPLNKEQVKQLYIQNINKILAEILISYSNMIRKFDVNLNELSRQTLNFLNKDLILRSETIVENLKLGFLGKELWRNLTPKYLTEFQILSPELGLKGRVDRVLISKQIIPYEIKTREQVYDSDKIQLAAYSLLLEEEFGKKVDKGVIETRFSQEEIQLTQELKNKVLELAENIRQIKEEDFQNNFNKCKSCKLRKECFEL